VKNLPVETGSVMIQWLAILVLLAGVVIDIKLLSQWRRHVAAFRNAMPAAHARLQARPWRKVDAIALLGLIFLTALPALFEAIHPSKTSYAVPGTRMIVLQFALVYGLIGGMIALAAWRNHSGISKGFGVMRVTLANDLRTGFFWGFACIPPTLLIACISNVVLDALGFDTSSQAVFDILSSPDLSMTGRIAIIGAAVVCAPLAEEMVFRGVVLPVVLRRFKLLGALLLVNGLFALFHFHLPAFAPLLALGMSLSVGMLATGSVMTPVIMHALFNAAAVLLFFAFPDIPV
jgi:membrane protease YdiL (CAAX protease family)